MRISITLLQYDHGIVRQVLDVVGEMVRTHQTSRRMPELKEALGFLEQFLDRFHHAKEEKFLFPAAAEEVPKMIGAMDRLTEEHAQARQMINRALAAIDAMDVEMTEQSSHLLVDHMTLHISEEENVVFPEIENCLSDDMDARLQEEYDRFTREGFGETYYQMAESFANGLQEIVLGPGYFKGIV